MQTGEELVKWCPGPPSSRALSSDRFLAALGCDCVDGAAWHFWWTQGTLGER